MGEGTGGFILFVRSTSRTTGKGEDRVSGRGDVGHERQHAEQETAERVEGGVHVYICLEVNICSFGFDYARFSSQANKPIKTFYT